MRAIIEKHGRFSYFWEVSHVRGFAVTHRGAVRAAKRKAREFTNWKNAKINAKVLDV
jgi:hypothetical protein